VLTGEWQHEDDASFRYHFEDDGAEVTVWVYRVFAPKDAGVATRLFPRPPSDGGTRAVDAGPLADSAKAKKTGARERADAGSREGAVPLIPSTVEGRDGGLAVSQGEVIPSEVEGRDGGLREASGSPDAGGRDHHHPLPADLLPRDGGTALLPSAVIHLRRTPEGFLGEAETLHLLASGRECRATFSTRISACASSTLTLVSAASTPMGDGCQTPALPQPAALLEHRLTRSDAGEL
jgi:hypothetical protein